jgi:hypothetical protein
MPHENFVWHLMGRRFARAATGDGPRTADSAPIGPPQMR